MYTTKFDTFLFDQTSLIGRILFYQINLTKKSQSKLKFPRVKKSYENKTTNE